LDRIGRRRCGHRIDWAELIHLRGDVARLLEIREVTDDR
jgi:hypothetical protein